MNESTAPLYLLKLDKKRKWDRIEVPWLQHEEVQADPLSDLAVQNGVLSLWYIEPDKSNLNSIIVAMAINRDKLQEFSYCLFDQRIITKLRLKIEANPGTTLITSVNHWHRDLIELTTEKAASFIRAIFYTMERPAVILPDELVEMMYKMIEQNELDYSTLKKNIKKDYDILRNGD